MNARALALALLFALCGTQVADALVLNCLRQPGRVWAYIDAHGTGAKPPMRFDVVRALIRVGKDEYEFEAEHMKQAAIGGDGVLRVHALRPLSAGATSEFRLEGTPPAAPQGAPFVASLWVRAENREDRGTVLCTLE